MVKAGSLSDQPSPYQEYTVRVTYYVSESKYEEDAYIYDVATFSVELKDDCSDFRWADTTDSPSDGTYNIKATSAAATHSISHPTNGLDATCSDSPTITLYYQEVGGITWNAIPATITTSDGLNPLTATDTDNSGDVDFDFDSATWDWGDQTSVTQNFRIVFAAATNSSETLTWDFTMTYVNFCSEDSISSYTSSPSDIELTLLNTYATSNAETSTASDPVWSVTAAGCSRDWNLQI